MTREEQAKYIAEKLMENPEFRKSFVGAITDAVNEAVKTIKALQQEPSISEDGTLTVYVEDGNKVSRVLVCGDNHFGGLYYPEYEPCENPHIYECSCGYGWDRRTMWRDFFCPNCGRKVQEVSRNE